MKGRNDSLIRRQRLRCIVTDWVTTAIAFFCFNVFRYYYLHLDLRFLSLWDYLGLPKMIAEQIWVPLGLLLVYWISGYYNRPLERSRLNDFLMTLYCQIFNALIIYLGALTNDQLHLRRENWIVLIVLFLLLFIFTYVGRFILTDNLIHNLGKSNFACRIGIVGISREAQEVALKLINSSNKLANTIVAFLPFDSEKGKRIHQEELKEIPILQEDEALLELCKSRDLDQIIVVPPNSKTSDSSILTILYQFFPYDVSIRIKPDIMSILTPAIRINDIKGEPFKDLTRPSASEFTKNTKRLTDILLSSLALTLYAPIMLGVIIAIKATDGGKIFYSQERIGYRRRPFKIYKFRSMVENAETDTPRLSSDTDPRITPLGHILRKYRIDEIPQFWNVLKGDMSIVGPRPERAYFIDKIVETAPWYSLVHQVRPGITSWGMVKYGYASTVEEMIERNRFDLIYLSNMSTAVDFKIMLHTINTVLSGKGK